MTIVAARWLPYRLPFVRPWTSAAGTVAGRSGRLLCLETADGRKGWGDCSPFPEIGITEDAAQRHAVECALLDLAAQAAGLPLSAWLAGGRATAEVVVNAVLGDLQRLREEEIAAAVAAGHSVLKIKVGVAAPGAEAARLREVAAGLPPGVLLRLDANRAWDEANARRFLEACAGLPVECCEEPLAVPDAPALARLQADLPFPLAVDESFDLVDDAFLAAPPVRRLVVKPARHGGLLPALDIALRARRAGMECVFTSALESACGLLASAHLAAAVAPGLAHGLAASGWFAADTGMLPAVENGRMRLPTKAGIGFRPDFS